MQFKGGQAQFIDLYFNKLPLNVLCMCLQKEIAICIAASTAICEFIMHHMPQSLVAQKGINMFGPMVTIDLLRIFHVMDKGRIATIINKLLNREQTLPRLGT